MFKVVDFRAVIFHEGSGCVAATEVLWFALSKETSPLIVLIHHSATSTHGDHKAFYFLLEMRSAQVYKLKNLRKAHSIAFIFDGTLMLNWINLLI